MRKKKVSRKAPSTVRRRPAKKGGHSNRVKRLLARNRRQQKETVKLVAETKELHLKHERLSRDMERVKNIPLSKIGGGVRRKSLRSS
jgi:hypothetical protein